jgi:acetyl esterase
MPLDPAIKAIYAQGPRRGAPSKDPVAERAEAMRIDRELNERYAVPAPPVPTEDIHLPVPDAPDVRLRLFRPESATPRPAYLVFFGGSFRRGGVEWASPSAAFAARAHGAGVVSVAVDYALAPEHPYPAAVNQGRAALRWIVSDGPAHGIDPTRIAIGGMSSGANIAASVALLNRDTDAIGLRLQLLEVPALDLTGGHLSLGAAASFGPLGPLVVVGLLSIARDYLGGSMAQVREPHASPLLAPDLMGLPPTRILTAQHDPLRRDGEVYAARLRRAGVDAAATRFAGMTHEASAYTKVLPGARMWHDTVVATLAGLHRPTGPTTPKGPGA